MAVTGGRIIAHVINDLLSLPFTLKVATKDFHPVDHISFVTSHSPPNNKPFESTVKIPNPVDETQHYQIPLWPVHCVQGTKGAEIIPEIQISKLHVIVEKGQDKRVEMFSGFKDVFGNKSSAPTSQDLASLLNSQEITHIFTVGIAGDFCVKCTALDAKTEGFQVYAVEDGIGSVNPGASGWGAARKMMEDAGIGIISMSDPQIARVKTLG